MTYLRSVRVRNFKAVRDSGLLKLGALTVFIGNNGAGKSSLIEALETYQRIVLEGVDAALGRFNGFEHARYKGVRVRGRKQAIADPAKQPNPINIYFRIAMPGQPHQSIRMQVNQRDPNRQYIQAERVSQQAGLSTIRDFRGAGRTYGEGRSIVNPLGETRPLYESVERWQFIALQPDVMGIARPQRRTSGRAVLDRDGSNLGGYVLDLFERAPQAFEGIVEAMQSVLPYALDFRPVMPSQDIDRRVYLELAERTFRVPSWLFSGGTLRLLAVLCMLRDPEPPPLLFIEEIENGLDPRTIGMLVEEIRMAITSGHTQVIATTHSPYLLDQLLFEHVVVVERNAAGEPEFWRPEDEASLAAWSKDFSLGQIYTMGQLRRAPKRSAKKRGRAK